MPEDDMDVKLTLEDSDTGEEVHEEDLEADEEAPEEVPEGKDDSFSPFDEPEGEDEVKPDSEDIDEDDRKIIDSRVKAQTARLEEDVTTVKVNQEVSEFLEQDGNEIYKPVASKIREYAKHPKAQGMSIEAIARMAVDPRELISEGAKKEREAMEETAEGMVAGSTGRAVKPEGDLPDAFKLSKEEFEKKVSGLTR